LPANFNLATVVLASVTVSTPQSVPGLQVSSKEERLFFSEEKKQKTFIFLCQLLYSG